jgi:hypothetical protein
MSNDNEYTELTAKYPFLTVGMYSGVEVIGIIQNSSKSIVSMYCLNSLNDVKLRAMFLALCDEYWWTSNRTVSINLFLKPDFDVFKPYLKHFSAKEFIVITGAPVISMSNMVKKRVKKKRIELVRQPTDKK